MLASTKRIRTEEAQVQSPSHLLIIFDLGLTPLPCSFTLELPFPASHCEGRGAEFFPLHG